MATNQFVREPIEGGDSNTWAGFLLPIVRDVIGSNTTELYDDSGTLKIRFGRVGIDDNSNQGVCLVEQSTSIDISLVSSGNWAQVELEVVGTTLVFTATNISGATNEKTLPSNFTSAYDTIKGGFYIDATKRTIGIIWKNSGGVLKGIVNTGNQTNSYNGAIELASGENYIFEKVKGITKSYYENLIKHSVFYSNTIFLFASPSTWYTMPIDNTTINNIPSVTLSSNQITLPPGKYKISAQTILDASFSAGTDAKIRLYDITNTTLLLRGIGSKFTGLGSSIEQMVTMLLEGVVDVVSSLTFELQMYTTGGLATRPQTNTDDVYIRQIMIERVE